MRKVRFRLFSLSLFVFLFLFFILMVAGCGTKKTKISILSHKIEIDKPLRDLCRIYEKENPNVKIDLQSIGGSSEYESSLLSRLNSKSVNIFTFEGFGNMKSLKDKLVDLSDMKIVNRAKGCNPDVLESAIDENGKVNGFPVAIEGYGYLVNRAAFEAAGIDISTVKNFAEFDDACCKLKMAIETNVLKEKFPNAKTVWKFPGKASWSYGNHALHVMLLGDFKNSMEAYNEPEVPFSRANDYRQLIDFQTKYSVEGEPSREKIANLNSVDYFSSFNRSFLAGRSFVCQQGTWVVPQIEKYDKDNKTNLIQQVDLLPYYTPGGDGKFVVSSGQCWGISNFSSDKEIECCKEFLEWLYNSPVAKDRMINEMKLISPVLNKDELKNTNFDNISQKIVNAYLNGDYFKGGSLGLVRTEGWSLQVVGTAIQEYIAGKIPFEEVVKRAKIGWSDKYKAQVKPS